MRKESTKVKTMKEDDNDRDTRKDNTIEQRAEDRKQGKQIEERVRKEITISNRRKQWEQEEGTSQAEKNENNRMKSNRET